MKRVMVWIGLLRMGLPLLGAAEVAAETRELDMVSTTTNMATKSPIPKVAVTTSQDEDSTADFFKRNEGKIKAGVIVGSLTIIAISWIVYSIVNVRKAVKQVKRSVRGR